MIGSLWVRGGIFEAALIDLDTTDWGLYLARPFRDKDLRVPVVGITSGNSDMLWPEQRAIFLENGGDDLVRNPANPRELAATLRAVSRRYKGSSLDVLSYIHYGHVLKLDRSNYIASLDNCPLRLTSKEYQMLEALCTSAGRTLSKEMILNRLYGGSDMEPEAKIIDVFICKIRRKLEEIYPEAKSFIETVWGRGYRINIDSGHSAIGKEHVALLAAT